jgi:hypothetical protein
MRKLEGVVKEILEEMEYLKEREERFSGTNRYVQTVFIMLSSFSYFFLLRTPFQCPHITACSSLRGSLWCCLQVWACGRYFIFGHSSSGSTLLIDYFHMRSRPMRARGGRARAPCVRAYGDALRKSSFCPANAGRAFASRTRPQLSSTFNL